METAHILLIITVVLLFITKLADLWTTVRYVGRHGETNPLARYLFAKFGFVGGLALVMALWGLIVALVYVSAWSAPAWIQVVTAIVGTMIAWVQLDVARFNATHKSTLLTRIAARAYDKWADRLRGRKSSN